MPSPPSTRPNDARGRRSSAFIREDTGKASGSPLPDGLSPPFPRFPTIAALIAMFVRAVAASVILDSGSLVGRVSVGVGVGLALAPSLITLTTYLLARSLERRRRVNGPSDR